MKIEWTKTGGSVVTLGDDAARQTIVIESLGGQSLEQVERLFRATVVSRFARGNVAGEFVFTSAKSHADYGVALTFFKAEYARLNEAGSLVATQLPGPITLTMAGAILRGVQRVAQEGLRWHLRYTFGITTIT